MRSFFHRPITDYKKSMEEALNLSRKINEALTAHDKKLRPNAGGKTKNTDLTISTSKT